MGRSLLILLLLLTSVLIVSGAEDDPGEDIPITVARDAEGKGLFGPLQGVWQPVTTVEAERVVAPSVPEAPQDHGNDTCANAAFLPLEDGTDGDFIAVNDMTSDPNDPVLFCMEGQPLNPRGYSTVWYRFIAPSSGMLLVYTDFDPKDYHDSYDTVLALYESSDGSCSTLQMVACNDDYRGFLSQINHFVIEGRIYYIEVADWHLANEQASYLRLAIVLSDGPSLWEGEGEMWLPRSRHMVVSDGTYLYIIAGEVAVWPFPDRDGNMMRFNPATGEWVELYPMPGMSLDDSHGYSRTSAVYLNGRIYVPSGYVGNNNIYAGAHRVYNVATDTWHDDLAAWVPWATASPSGAPYAWAETTPSPRRNGYYLIGGLLSGDPNPTFPADAEPTDNFLFYDATNDRWVSGLPTLQRARYAHVAATLQVGNTEKICAAGGIGKLSSNQAAVLRSVECYSLGGGWEYVAPLNFPRFAAGSAVGPDGRWYVFGGINAFLEAVTVTEVYDPVANRWEVLDSRYGLRDPGRAWPRGAFVGDDLWIFGGEIWGQLLADGERQILVVPLMERLTLPQNHSFIPFIARAGGSIEPNDILDDAWPILMNVEQWHTFADEDDFFDVYRWDVATTGRYEFIVDHIPAGRDYDVYLYNDNKVLVGDSFNVGSAPESAVTRTIIPGTYYAVVVRAYGEPTLDSYRILVRPYVP